MEACDEKFENRGWVLESKFWTGGLVFFFQIAALKKTSPLSKTSAPAPPPVFEYLVALGSSTSSGDATTLTHILFFSKPFRIVILFLDAAVWFLGCLFILHVAVG